MVLRKSFYIRWSAGRSPRVHEVNPGRDPSIYPCPQQQRKTKLKNNKIKLDTVAISKKPIEEIILAMGKGPKGIEHLAAG